MKLEINGEVYQVPREYELKIFDQLWNREALPWYEKLDSAWKIGAMVISRGILMFMESQIAKETGDKEKAKAVRPPRGADPNLHAGELLAKILLEGLNSVTIACETATGADGEKSIIAFNVQVDSKQHQLAVIGEESEGQAR